MFHTVCMGGYSVYTCTLTEAGVAEDLEIRIEIEDTSSYGDALLVKLQSELGKRGVSDIAIRNMVDDLHAQYGASGELNIRPGENEDMWTAAGRYTIRITLQRDS